VHPFRTALTSVDSFATTLLVVAVQTYGTECLTWTPDTLLIELQEDFNCVVPQENLDKLMAAVTIVTTDRFRASLPDFIDICNALSGTPLDTAVFDPADTYEIAWGMTEAELLWPQHDTEINPQIIGYIENVLADDSFIRAPKILQPFIPDFDKSVNFENFGDAEDADIYSGMFQNQQERVQDVDAAVAGNIEKLKLQLTSLNLENGTGEDILQKLFKEMAE